MKTVAIARDPPRTPRLLAGMCLLVGVPSSLLLTATLLPIRDSMEQRATWQVERAAADVAIVIRSEIEGLLQKVHERQVSPRLLEAVRSQDATRATQELRGLVQSGGGIDRAFLTDARGDLWAEHPADETDLGRNLAHRDWYRKVRESGDIYVSGRYARAVSPLRTVVVVAAPVRIADEDAAYLVAHVGVPWLASRVGSQIQLGDGDIHVRDQHGQLLLRLRDDTVVQETGRPSVVHAAEDAGAANWEPGPITTQRPIDPYGWVVLAHLPVERVLAPWESVRNRTAILFLVFFVSTAGFGVLWLESIRRRQQTVVELRDQRYLMGQLIVHDLRTPLTAIALSLEMAEASFEDPAVQRSDLRRAQAATRNLRQLADDLHDILRMEDGEYRPRFEEQDVREIVRDRVAALSHLLVQRKLEIDVELPAEPLPARVDRGLLGRTVENLLTNAAKHTPEGGSVAVHLRMEDDAIHLDVSDTGSGIEPDQVERLFRKYGRIDPPTAKAVEGSGLGLLFCSLAVAMHGGRIEVDSAPGRGTEFRVTIPKDRGRDRADGVREA